MSTTQVVVSRTHCRVAQAQSLRSLTASPSSPSQTTPERRLLSRKSDAHLDSLLHVGVPRHRSSDNHLRSRLLLPSRTSSWSWMSFRFEQFARVFLLLVSGSRPDFAPLMQCQKGGRLELAGKGWSAITPRRLCPPKTKHTQGSALPATGDAWRLQSRMRDAPSFVFPFFRLPLAQRLRRE